MATHNGPDLPNGNHGVANSNGDAMEELMRKLNNSMLKQQIILQGTDDLTCYNIYGQDVSIMSSSASGSTEASAGSNKVKINPAVKYDWEQEYYLGNIVASHKIGAYIAYVLKGRSGGVVRIMNRKTAERGLLKGFQGRVIDISFAHIDEVILACVDETGSLYISSVLESGSTILTPLLVRINRPENLHPTTHHRVIWCPYIPEECSDDDLDAADDVGKLLVLTHDNLAELYNMDTIMKNSRNGQTLVSIEISDGYQILPGHEQLITDAMFSPDGSALATTSSDGEVRVFSVAINEDASSPKCLHKWKPHDGKPLSTLVFLDNYKQPQTQFWKFAITGANYNQEIKLWSCVSWTCLQTVRFLPPPDNSIEPCLKAGIDATAEYLILSDIHRKAMYVFNVYQDWEDGRARLTSVSEFLLTSPCLSFTILEAGRKKFKKTIEGDNLGEYTTGIDSCLEDNEAEESVVCTFIRMYSVHTKALQELQIQYEPDAIALPAGSSISSMSQDDHGFRDGLTDISMDTVSSDVDALEARLAITRAPLKPYLLTPEAFSQSPRKLSEAESVGSSLTTTSSSLTQVTPVREDDGMSFLTSPTASSVLSISRDSYTPLTPSSIPLPPVTPGEEVDTNRSYHSLNSDSLIGSPRSSIKLEANAFSSPRQTSPKELTQQQPSHNVQKKPALADLPTSDTVKALFAAAAGSASASPRSVNSSRSGSLEVDSILHDDQTPVSSQHQLLVSNQHVEPAPLEGTVVAGGPYDSTIWPKAPDVASEAKRLVNEVLQNTGAVDESDAFQSSGDVVEDSVVDDPNAEDQNETRNVATGATYAFKDPSNGIQSGEILDSRSVSGLQTSLNEVTALLKSQQQELISIKEQVRVQQQLLHHHQQHHQQLHQLSLQQQQNIQQSLAEHSTPSAGSDRYLERIDAQLSDLQISISRQVDSTLTRFMEDQKQQVQDMAIERTNSERQRHDRLATTVAQQVATVTAGRLDKSMKQEIKSTIMPGMAALMQPLNDQIRLEMAQKLTATDQIVRENIQRLVQSKPIVDSIGQNVGIAVQGQIEAVYRDTLQKLIIPSFERACQDMYRQMNDCFVAGTREYQGQLESHTEKLRKKLREAREPSITQLQQTVELLHGATQELKVNLSASVKHDLEAQMQDLTVGLKESVTEHVRTIVHREIENAMKQHNDTIQNSVLHAMRSSAATPLPNPQSPDPQQLKATILHLLQQGHLNTAFQQALSASNLSVVMYVCETVNPATVFNQGEACPLQQPVLLSLIQQLSADLAQSTELKHQYIEEAVMNLDTSNALTKEHMPAVMQALCAKLGDFIQQNPSHKMTRQMRMLLMASKSLSDKR